MDYLCIGVLLYFQLQYAEVNYRTAKRFDGTAGRRIPAAYAEFSSAWAYF